MTDSIEVILNNNSYQFNKVNYCQSLKTAMRTKKAPIYVILTLAYLEVNLYEITEKNTTTT